MDQSNDRIEAAVAAGAIDAEAAARLKTFMAQEEATASQVDEENIRLVTSFNDIFVSIAIILALVPSYAIGALFGAMVSWGLAEYFTRKKRMALPSILLAVTFSLAIAKLSSNLFWYPSVSFNSTAREPWNNASGLIGVGIITAIASLAYWKRFRVPISIACATVAIAASMLGTVIIILSGLVGRESAASLFSVLCFLAGVAIFAFAMRWDISDPERRTNRSDVAFWLHLAASPLIVHPIFVNLGIMSRGQQDLAGPAIIAIMVYLALGLVAVAVDRRAMLVSALIYVLVAVYILITNSGAEDLSFLAAPGIIGGMLLMLSAFWQPVRRQTLALLPVSWRQRLPRGNTYS